MGGSYNYMVSPPFEFIEIAHVHPSLMSCLTKSFGEPHPVKLIDGAAIFFISPQRAWIRWNLTRFLSFTILAPTLFLPL